MRDDASPRFRDVVTSEAELRALMGEIYPAAVTKVIDNLDEHCRAFIARSPFILVASGSAEHGIDVSPKGDPAGFVHVIDDRTLAIPDRPGNNRLDTFRNLLANPAIGLIFLVPGRKDTLRVSGQAQIVRDEALRRQMAVDGKVPELATVVAVERAFFHCAKCMVRSSLWDPKGWPDLAGLPSLAAALVSHSRLKASVVRVEQELAQDEKDGLY